MTKKNKRRHVFISHHHADDAEVDKLTALLSKGGCDIRNSSIRAKPANQRRLNQGLVKDETIRRLLRMKISWAGTVIVLIGKDTHSRPWVDWEIKQANRQGKTIIGIYAQRGTEADIPTTLKNYATDIVAWNTQSIMNAIDAKATSFQKPDGSDIDPIHTPVSIKC